MSEYDDTYVEALERLFGLANALADDSKLIHETFDQYVFVVKKDTFDAFMDAVKP